MGKYGDWTRGEDEALLNILGGSEVARAVLRNEKRIRVEDVIKKSAIINPTLASWQSFYHDHLGMDVDLSSVVIPPPQPGFDQVIVIPQGLTLNQVVAAMRKHFSVYTYINDLDRDVPVNERDPKKGSYAIRIRPRVEADKELKNLSANQIAGRKFATLTLLERLVYEYMFYSETKSHLDVSNVTLCTGSRDSGGSVPCVDWLDGRLYVGWCGAGRADGDLRARQAAV